MHDGIIAAVMLTELMNLGMTVVAAGDTVIRTGLLDLLILQPAEFQPLFFHAGLQKTTAAAAAIIVGAVGNHVNKIFFANYRFDHISQVFGNGIAKGLAHDLTGIVERQTLIAHRAELELSAVAQLIQQFQDVHHLERQRLRQHAAR